jgi:predicted phosphate transport protein (TIGR00153 family)
MSLTSVFRFLSPKDQTFGPLFEEDTANLVAMGKTLNAMVRARKQKERDQLSEEIDRLESQGDEITHQIFVALGKTFITPFDREDVHALAASLDDIADYMQGAAARARLYNIISYPPAILDLVEILQQGIAEVAVAVSLVMTLKDRQKIREALVKIHSLENEADRVFNRAIEELFRKEKNAIQLIKMKELLATIETATDRCEDVANVIESIVIKYS